MQEFRKLQIWSKARSAARDISAEALRFPDYEKYVLTSQLRRAAISVMVNISEGCGKSTRRDFARYITITLGSAKETEALLILAGDFGYLAPEACRALVERMIEIQKMGSALLRRLTSD